MSDLVLGLPGNLVFKDAELKDAKNGSHGGIRTRELLISSCLLYHSATTDELGSSVKLLQCCLSYLGQGWPVSYRQLMCTIVCQNEAFRV